MLRSATQQSPRPRPFDSLPDALRPDTMATSTDQENSDAKKNKSTAALLASATLPSCSAPSGLRGTSFCALSLLSLSTCDFETSDVDSLCSFQMTPKAVRTLLLFLGIAMQKGPIPLGSTALFDVKIWEPPLSSTIKVLNASVQKRMANCQIPGQTFAP